MITGAALLNAIPTHTFSPLDVFDRRYWQGDTLVSPSSGSASTWTDLVIADVITFGLGLSVNQPTAGVTWTAGNGVTAISFAPVAVAFGKTAAAALPASGDYSIYFLGNFVDTNVARCACEFSASAGSAISQDGAADGKLEYWNRGIAFCGDGSALTTPIGILCEVTIGANCGLVCTINGVTTPMANATSTLMAPSGVLTVGSLSNFTFPFKGYMYAIGIRGSRMSSAQRAALFAWQLAKVGV